MVDPWERTLQQRIEDALQQKALGTEKYKEKDFHFSGSCYIQALRDVIPVIEDKDQTDELRSLKTVCYANLAACQLNLGQYERVILNCTKCLSIDANNVKCLYRRAQSNLEIGYFHKVREDLNVILTLEPNNEAAKLLEKKLKSMLHEKDLRDKELMKNFMKTTR